eukprot:gene12618-16919_t
MLARVKLKGIDGGPHQRWSMWFNSMQHEEPYQDLTLKEVFRKENMLRPFNRKTADYKSEEGEDDVKSSCPLRPGLHTCYNGYDKKLPICENELISKHIPSSDCRLQLAYMKVSYTAVNPFPGLVHTARHTMGAGYTRSYYPNLLEGSIEGRIGDWGEVVTR